MCSFTVLFSLAAVHADAAQIISSDTSSAITATGGDFTVNAGVTVSTAVNTTAVTVSGVDVPNFTNNGSIMTPTSGGTAVNFNSTDAMANIVNTGTMQSKSGVQLNSPAAIVNSGDMVGSDRTITLYTGATGSTINNSFNLGVSVQDYAAISNMSATIASIFNASTGTIAGFVPIENNSVITTLTNSGNIHTTHFVASPGIGGSGSIGTLTNYGTISGAHGGYGVQNHLTTLANEQGRSSSPLTSFYQPSNYSIIVGSRSNYGELSIGSPSGTMSFGILEGSVLVPGAVYTNVLSGITVANLADTSGTYDSGLPWNLVLEGGQTNVWDLTVSDVPEPGPLSILGIGMTAVMFVRRHGNDRLRVGR